MTTKPLTASLVPFGLCVLGQTEVPSSEGTLFLIGPNEPQFWPIFRESTEFADGSPDPLDRWSRRVLTEIATHHAGEALFPFGGPPFMPFQTWATQSGRFWPSPIGFLVHDTAGLFVSFRGAIVLSEPVPQPTTALKPCDSCAAPCKSACPVGAFNNGYDVAACKTHLATPQGNDCMTQGCRARRACPINQGHRLPPQANHHMKAFL